MPLFDNWPYVDLSKLNLDWIMLKIKHVEQAEADAQEVIDAAAQIIPQIDNINAAAARAEEAAADAEHSKDEAFNYEEAALNHVAEARGAENRAKAAQLAAETAANNAELAKDQSETNRAEASASASTALDSADQARTSAAAATQAALRAEAAAGTTGFTGHMGSIAQQGSVDIPIHQGSYLVIYKVDDDQLSSGIFYVIINSAGTATTRKLMTYTGGSANAVVSTSNGNLRILNTSAATLHYTVLGVDISTI